MGWFNHMKGGMEEVHQVPSGKEEGRYIHVFPVEVSEDLPF